MPKEETYYKGKGNTNASVTTQLNKNKILVVKEKVANSLIRKAIEKDDTLSQIFFLKTQAGWVEKRQVEVTQKKELIQIIPADNFQIEEAEIIDADQGE